MKSRILGFAGHKQSGKTTCCNFLHGYQLRAQRTIDDFAITDEGKLVIDTDMVLPDGQEQKSKGLLDVKRSDLEFAEWAAYSMWPYIKHYSFSDPLKQISIGLFGLTQEQCYGTDGQKNTLTNVRWGDIPGITAPKNKKRKKMTAREFLQYFGTEVCRKIKEDVWSQRCIEDIQNENPLIAVIDDCRFMNEVDAIQNAEGKIIKLTRSAHEDSHSSECALDDWENYDAIIDNKNMTINETCVEIIKLLTEWGWLAAEVKPQPQEEPQPELVGGIHKFKQEDE
tara:strand:- start:387 stop:1232 length:846 start_codon:yes stop_codon:yes gene_type:complete